MKKKKKKSAAGRACARRGAQLDRSLSLARAQLTVLREDCDLLAACLLEAQSGERPMLSALWAQQIISARRRFEEVPTALRAQVGALLEDCGLGLLARE